MKIVLNKHIKDNLLTILTISAVVLGVLIGIILRSTALGENENSFSERTVMYVNFIGDTFLRMLKSLILPLIISSLVAAVGGLDISLSKKIGTRAIFYYMATTVLAVTLGIILVTTIRPGVGGSTNDTDLKKQTRNVTTADTMLDLVRNIFPPNLVQACLQQYQTVLKKPENGTDDMYTWKIGGQYTDGMNIMGLVVASIVFGIGISTARSRSLNVLNVFNELSHLMMRITRWVIWLSPVGVFFLILAKILEMDDILTVFGKLGLYFLTVSGGILIHGFVFLPAIYFFMTRKNPYKFILNMSQAIATAFGTSSSSATLPVTLQCLENYNHIDPRVSRFVIPIGATINMDGTALYEAVAAIFISQLKGGSLTFGNILAVSITATAASIGAAGIPQAGLVTLVMVLDTLGLPAEDVSLIIAVDWLLDRVRTVVNVLGDSLGAGIVAHLSRKELEPVEVHVNEGMKFDSTAATLVLEDANGNVNGKGTESIVMDQRM